MARRKTDFSKTETVGYGFVGRWGDGTLGWVMPEHLSDSPNYPKIENWNRGESLVLCKITAELVTDSLGRPITRRLGEADDAPV